MESIKVDFENCYGIKKLEYEFDFSDKPQNVLYAPNGVMKSSFAKTFQDLSEGKDSVDRVYPDRETKRQICDENSDELEADSVFVIEPYSSEYKSQRVSTLLVNQTLKSEYEAVYEEINNKKELLVNCLVKLSGVKKDVDEVLSIDIMSDKKEFFKSLNRLKSEVEDVDNQHLADLTYGKIFTDKVETFLSDPSVKQKISEYMSVYDTLTSNSNFFKKGVFNHNNASDIAKNLKVNGFFKASHSVYINSKDVKKEITNEKELEEVIREEKDNILESDELRSSFEAIDKLLTKNAEMRGFRNYLSDNESLIPELENPSRLKQRLWVAYLSKHSSEYQELLDTFESGKEKIENIVQAAKAESTKWRDVIDVFNSRFSVPFLVTMENQEDVILKSDAPSIKFRFKGGVTDDEVPIEEGKLIDILSNGERRALYILNIIFEITARIEAEQDTVFVIDDIADSFDYKNKYAIVEYLSDISEAPFFRQIILTHNFDFFRTISSRLDLKRKNILHSVKSNGEIKIIQETYQNNPFTHWKNNFQTTDEYVVAMIPFVRNLAEFSGMKDEEDELTSYLHIKANTLDLTIKELGALFERVMSFENDVNIQDEDRKVLDVIYSLADSACQDDDELMELETKIILAIAVRLQAEEFIKNKIADDDFVDSITKNQTRTLFNKFKELFPCEVESINTLRQVNLMTPENIHLNSFMYEPILDMSNEHLKALNSQVKDLS